MTFPTKIATLLFFSICSAHAENQTGGFYLGADVSHETMTVKTSGSSENFGSGRSLILHAGYELPIQDRYAVLFGTTYDLDYYLQGGSGSSGTSFSKSSETLKQKTKWGIYAAPGVYFKEDHLIYAKLIYTTLKTDPDGIRSSSPNFTSTGYGLGYRYTYLKDNLISLEWASLPTSQKSFSSFRSGTSIAPNLSMFTIGWAKKF